MNLVQRSMNWVRRSNVFLTNMTIAHILGEKLALAGSRMHPLRGSPSANKRLNLTDEAEDTWLLRATTNLYSP